MFIRTLTMSLLSLLPFAADGQTSLSLQSDAAIVGPDKIAYGDSWAVTAPGFREGNLIYKISRNLSDIDTARCLHRGSSGEDDLNVMARDLNMGGHDVYNIGGIDGKSLRVRSLDATFVTADTVDARTVYFSSGAPPRPPVPSWAIPSPSRTK